MTIAKKILVSEPQIGELEIYWVTQALKQGWISSSGPFVKEFEEKMASLSQRRFGSSCSSGTAALILALKALDIKKGDEVILPSFTIISCVQAILEVEATPVFVDCDENTYNLDVSLIRTKITSKTKAIMAVHMYGLTNDMDEIVKIAEEKKIKVIEDASQAHGQVVNGKSCGSFGDISIFSFYANKHVTCGEGGMVVTDDEQLFERCQYFKNLCFQKQRFVHQDLGHNFRLGSLQAALGIAQLESLDARIQKKQDIALRYMDALKEAPYILPQIKTDYSQNHFWVFPLVYYKKKATEMIELLAQKNIEARPFFFPLHKQPVFKGVYEKEKLEVTEKISEHGFYIPCHTNLTEHQCQYIIETLKELS